MSACMEDCKPQHKGQRTERQHDRNHETQEEAVVHEHHYIHRLKTQIDCVSSRGSPGLAFDQIHDATMHLLPDCGELKQAQRRANRH